MQHSKTINAIDIGTSKVTTIIGQHFPSENRLNVIAVSSKPAKGFKKGQIIDLDQASLTLTDSVESAERMAGQSINHACVAIASPEIESLNSKGVVAISDPQQDITQQDINRAVGTARAISLPAGKEIIHIIPRVFTVDGQEGIIDPIGMSGTRLEVEAHIILTNSSAIKNLQKCLHQTDINIDSLVYSGLPAAQVALTQTDKELGVALVDIGGQITTITIFNSTAPCFSTVLPIGANNITSDMAIGLRLALDQAETIKLNLQKALKDKRYEDDIDLSYFDLKSDHQQKISLQTTVSGIITPRLEEIFQLINLSLDRSGYKNSIPSGLVLTGGGCQTINAVQICQQTIPLPLRIAKPPKVGGVVDDILNPGYTSSIGLLFYCLDLKKTKNSPNNKKFHTPFNGFLGRVKNLLEPLLP